MRNETSNPVNTRLRVMIVEDEADIGLILTQMLSARYEVVYAANGLEALERLNWYQPDITIMDLMMPVLDGYDTTRAIKKDNEYSSMPVMFLTARHDNGSVREALMAGGDVYLAKPFDPPELMLRLQEMVERNAIKSRQKRYTLDEIKRHFSGEQPPPAQNIEPFRPDARPLTEQLAIAAAEPKARVLMINSFDKPLKEAQALFRGRYELLVCNDAELALDKIMAYEPDILVISVNMTTFNPLHFTSLLQINRQINIPHIIFTGETDTPEVEEKAVQNGIIVLPGSRLNIERLDIELNRICNAPSFQRRRKRLDYREILRREDTADIP